MKTKELIVSILGIIAIGICAALLIRKTVLFEEHRLNDYQSYVFSSRATALRADGTFVPDLSYFRDKTRDHSERPLLFVRVSNGYCSPCLNMLIEQLDTTIPDYKDSTNIVFLTGANDLLSGFDCFCFRPPIHKIVRKVSFFSEKY